MANETLPPVDRELYDQMIRLQAYRKDVTGQHLMRAPGVVNDVMQGRAVSDVIRNTYPDAEGMSEKDRMLMRERILGELNKGRETDLRFRESMAKIKAGDKQGAREAQRQMLQDLLQTMASMHNSVVAGQASAAVKSIEVFGRLTEQARGHQFELEPNNEISKQSADAMADFVKSHQSTAKHKAARNAIVNSSRLDPGDTNAVDFFSELHALIQHVPEGERANVMRDLDAQLGFNNKLVEAIVDEKVRKDMFGGVMEKNADIRAIFDVQGPAMAAELSRAARYEGAVDFREETERQLRQQGFSGKLDDSIQMVLNLYQRLATGGELLDDKEYAAVAEGVAERGKLGPNDDPTTLTNTQTSTTTEESKPGGRAAGEDGAAVDGPPAPGSPQDRLIKLYEELEQPQPSNKALAMKQAIMQSEKFKKWKEDHNIVDDEFAFKMLSKEMRQKHREQLQHDRKAYRTATALGDTATADDPVARADARQDVHLGNRGSANLPESVRAAVVTGAESAGRAQPKAPATSIPASAAQARTGAPAASTPDMTPGRDPNMERLAEIRKRLSGSTAARSGSFTHLGQKPDGEDDALLNLELNPDIDTRADAFTMEEGDTQRFLEARRRKDASWVKPEGTLPGE